VTLRRTETVADHDDSESIPTDAASDGPGRCGPGPDA
jgi:hypothetical protein